MRKCRFTESQIVAILNQGEAGVPIPEILRQHSISKATYFQWRSKYAGASVDELKRLKELEAEANVRRAGPGECRDQGRPQQDHGLPVRRACQVVRLSRAAYCRPRLSRLLRDTDVVTALNDVVARPTRGASGSASIGCGGPATPGTTSACTACTAPSA